MIFGQTENPVKRKEFIQLIVKSDDWIAYCLGNEIQKCYLLLDVNTNVTILDLPTSKSSVS